MEVTVGMGTGDLVYDGYVLFADNAAANSEQTVLLPDPEFRDPNGKYMVSVNNPSLVSDLTVGCYNSHTMQGAVKWGLCESTIAILKTSSVLPSTYDKPITGLFLGETSKLSIKNDTQLTQYAAQLLTRSGTYTAGVCKFTLLGADGITTFTTPTPFCDWNASNATLSTKITDLIAAAGYTKGVLGVMGATAITATVTGTGTFDSANNKTVTLSDCGTTIIPLLGFVTNTLEGAGTCVVSQSAVGAIRVNIQVTKF